MKPITIIGFALIGCVNGCHKGADDDDAPASATASVALPLASTATPMVAGSAQVPTEEDFEQAAERSITPANLNDEVAKLQKEIEQ